MSGPQTAVVVPGVSPDVFPWDKYPVPDVLYKYFPPERLPVLTRCLVRFSQRQVFEDTFELLPEVASFGNEEEMRKFMEIDPVLSRGPRSLREAVIHHVLNTPGRHAKLIEQTQGALSEIKLFGVLCLSEDPTSVRMWQQYADNGRGFLVAFNTRHAAFNGLRSPGRLGKVEYSDQPIASFLAAYGANTFSEKELDILSNPSGGASGDSRVSRPQMSFIHQAVCPFILRRSTRHVYAEFSSSLNVQLSRSYERSYP